MTFSWETNDNGILSAIGIGFTQGWIILSHDTTDDNQGVRPIYINILLSLFFYIVWNVLLSQCGSQVD